MRILVASYGRAGHASTMDLVPSAQIVVPESQGDDYRHYYGDRVITIPDELDGNVAKKRNACIDMCEEGELFWLLDDDLIEVQWIKHGAVSDIESVLFNHWALMSSYESDKVFGFGGFSVYNDPVKYAEYAPFSLNKPSYGAVCIRATEGLRYDIDLGRFEDSDYYLWCLHRGMRVLRDNRYYFDFQDNSGKKSTDQVGGIAGNEAQFDKALQKLIKRWGHLVKMKDGKMNGVKPPRSGV